VLVYRWVDGEPVVASDTRTLLLLAQTVAQVHSHPADEVQRFSPRPFSLDYFWRVLAGGFAPIQGWLDNCEAPRLARGFARLAGQAQRVVEAALPAAQHAPPSLVHGDLKLENCVSSWGSIVLVDWEMFGLGDPALEAATLLHASRGELDSAFGDEWLGNYLDAMSQPGLGERIGVYRQLLPLQDLCFLLAGVRDLTPADRAQPDFAGAAEFLAQTLLASVFAATEALNEAPTADAGGLSAEISALLA
jgi:aminoglycoside phosphotransferase (APT) family kinase protein